MKFIHITDIHFVDEGMQLHGGDPSVRFAACLDDIAKWHSDAEFCVISGDLVEFGTAESYQLLKSHLEAFPLPCHLMVGNHDNRTALRSIFHDRPLGDGAFVQHRVDAEAGCFLFLDTKKDGPNEHAGQLCPERLAWLKDQLIDAGDRPCYLFMHHPPFKVGIPYVDDIGLLEADAFFETLRFGRNIRHAFFGHIHRMTYVNWRGIPFTSLPSMNHQLPLNPDSVEYDFCDEPPAYGVVLIENDQLTMHFNPFLHRNPLP